MINESQRTTVAVRVIGTTLLLLGIIGLYWPSPIFIGPHPDAMESVDTYIDLWGGLPQQDAELGAAPPPGIVEVATWRTDPVQLANVQPLAVSLLDDDPMYRIAALVEVEYHDGSRATLQWRTWNYGVILGNYVISSGDGPPGHLTLLDMQPAVSVR